MKNDNRGETKTAQAVWAFWTIIVILAWSYSLVVFPDQLRTSMVYILLGLISLVIYLMDNNFALFKDYRFDIPINLITWDNFKWRNIAIGLGVAVVFVILSKVTNAAFVGIPTQVGSFSLDHFGKILYTASVGIVENAVICSFPMSMIAVFFTFLFKENFNIKSAGALQTLWIASIIIGALASGFVAVQYHQVAYANQSANLNGVFILFTTFALMTGLLRDSSAMDVAHTAYNFSLVFLAIVPLAVAGI
jgi:hypothetical protein